MKKEIFTFGIKDLFNLIFTVRFIEEGDVRIIHAEKANIILTVDKTTSINQSKKQFAKLVEETVITALRAGEFAKTINSWGFKRMAYNEAVKHKQKEINKSILELNEDKMFELSSDMMLRQNSTSNWAK